MFKTSKGVQTHWKDNTRSLDKNLQLNFYKNLRIDIYAI